MKNQKKCDKKYCKGILFLSTAIIVLILDQLTKLLLKNLKEPIIIIKNFLQISITHNTGASFGIFKGQTMMFVWFSIIAIGIILYLYDKIPEKGYCKYAAALIFAGIIGNLTDRLAYGSVIDFIDFSFWPSFNIADSALTVGVIMLVFYLWRK